MTPESIATKERHGRKLLPKSCFHRHKCEAKCVGCRKTFVFAQMTDALLIRRG